MRGELEITETLAIDVVALGSGITIDAQQNSRVLMFSSTSSDLTLNASRLPEAAPRAITLTLRTARTVAPRADQ